MGVQDKGRQGNKQIRRVVTALGGDGFGRVLSDSSVMLKAFSGVNAQGAVLWTTRSVPADNVNDLVGGDGDVGMSLKGGSVLRITEFGPGFISPMHRTASIDYGVVLSGELVLELDSGAALRLRPGNAFVQRGGNHVWRNPSPILPCRIAVCMIEAVPMVVAGKTLRQTPAWMMVAGLVQSQFHKLFRMKSPTNEKSWPKRSGLEVIDVAVTSHDPAGKAVFYGLNGVAMGSSELALAEAILWSTDSVPANNDLGHLPKEGRRADAPFFGGSEFRLVELGPKTRMPVLQTNSIDYCIVLAGVVELIVEGGGATELHSGDVVVSRGPPYFWRNPSEKTPTQLVIWKIEAKPQWR